MAISAGVGCDRARASTFDLEEIQVTGNTVLPGNDIEAVVYPHVGPARSEADVEQARAALEKLYLDRGFPTVSVEAAGLADGVAILKVIERRVGRLRVVGAQYSTPSSLKAGAPSLAPGTVLNTAAVQNDILGLNQIPSRTVTPALKPGRAPNTVDADLQVEDRFPGHGTLELNNRRSADTTELRLSGSVGYDNLFQRGDSASLGFQLAPQNRRDATVFTGSYLFRIPNSRLSLLGSYVKSDSNVATLGGTNVLGRGQIAGLRLLIPVNDSGGLTQSLALGFDYKNFPTTTRFGSQVTDLPLEYWPLTATYAVSWAGESSQTDGSATVVYGTRGLGTGNRLIVVNPAEPREAAFDASRAYARTNFYFLRLAANHQHELPYGLQVSARGQTQFGPEPLLAQEQFSLGGQDSVRGYLETEAVGDTGANLQLELRGPQLADRLGPKVQDARGYLFGDVGGAIINRPLEQQTRSYTFGSVGAGVRVRLYDHFTGTVENAIVLARGPNSSAGSDRVLFRLIGDF